MHRAKLDEEIQLKDDESEGKKLLLGSKSEIPQVRITKEVPQLVANDIEKLRAIFPQVFVEGKVDFEKLKTTLDGAIDQSPDKFTFSWAGRRNAIQILQMPTRATLVPVKNESLEFDRTRNIIIEGDNLEVLKLLCKAYFGKVKVIYIDPPYNTGHDYIFQDNYADPLDSYLRMTKQKSVEGNSLTSNPETSGRYHSKWLSMMYPRLFVARNLLSEDGVIFVSIGQEELNNLITILNEIFGEENKIGVISRLMKSGGSKGEFFSPNIDYILVYARNISLVDSFRLSLEKEYIDRIYTLTETEGSLKGQKYREMGLYQAGLEKRQNQRYWIKCPDGSLAIPPGKTFPSELTEGIAVTPQDGDGVWRWIYRRYHQELELGNIVFKKTNSSSLKNQKGEKSNWNIYTKIWLKDRVKEGRVPTDLITKYENRLSSAELKKLDIPFDFAKPSKLISYLLSFFDSDDLTVLDFFAGSGTTAHSVLELNNNDRGHRKFVLVQLPEPTPDGSDARKKGYETIAEICKERVRRVISSIKNQNIGKLETNNGNEPEDLGFKIFKLAESNYKPWKGVEEKTPEKYAAEMEARIDSLVKGWKEENVIYEVAIKEGYGLNVKIELETKCKENRIWRVTDLESQQSFLICLDDKIKYSNVKNLEIAKDQMFVCRDIALDDTTAANLALTCRLKTI